MTWVRIDDGLAFHAKVIAAGNAALGLWLRCCCWSAAQLTDGIIPVAVAKTLGTHKEAMALEEARLWRREGDTWVIPDWLDYQPSAAQVREERRVKHEAKARAGRAGAAARWNQSDGRADGTPMADGSQSDSKPMAPTRPDPTPMGSTSSETDRLPTVDGRSSFDQALDLMVGQLAIAAGKAMNPGWKSGTRRNQAAERGDAIRTMLDQGRSVEEVARIALTLAPHQAPPRTPEYFTAPPPPPKPTPDEIAHVKAELAKARKASGAGLASDLPQDQRNGPEGTSTPDKPQNATKEASA